MPPKKREEANVADDNTDVAAEIAYVEMVRDPEMYPEPHTAQVHPAEVDNYRAGGWTPAA